MAFPWSRKQAPTQRPGLPPAPGSEALATTVVAEARGRVYASRDDDDELDAATEMAALVRLRAAMESEFKKSMSYANFVSFENQDDQGGYFGTEFELRATAGRIKGLYSREPWIYTCATHIARTLAQIPMRAYQPGKDDRIENHPLEMLWAQGSPSQSQKDLRWCENLDLTLGGNYFLLLEQDLKKIAGLAPVELVNLKYTPDYRSIEAIDVYSGAGGPQYARFPMEQVIHVKLPNPYNFLYGMSPFCAAARPIFLDRYKNEFEMAFYLRGATSTGVVEMEEDMSKSRFQRLLRTFEQAFTGRSNWWRTMFLPKGAKWKTGQLTMEEMQHLDGLRENRKTILAVLGIPGSLVGIIEDVNRATAEQQERIFWQNTIVPLAWFIASSWNNSHLVKGLMKGKVELRPDFTGIEAVEGFTSAKAEKAAAMAPYYFIDEIREKVWGDEPIPNGGGQKFVAEIKPIGTGVPPVQLAAPSTPLQLPAAAKSAIPAGSEVVYLYLMKERFATEGAAVKWAADNGFTYTSMRENATDWCLTQQDVDAFDLSTVADVSLGEGVRATCMARKKDVEAEQKAAFLVRKAAATAAQNRIESGIALGLERALTGYLDLLLGEARSALLRKAHLAQALANHREERATYWRENAVPFLYRAMERGFSAGSSLVKAAVVQGQKRARFTGLSETDRQAVDILKDRTADGRRRTLAERGIERFVGLDATRTDAVEGLVETGLSQGKSYEEIARDIRADYDEAYRNQARTIVRTEILTAVSAGMAWNHAVLGEIFTEVRKQWMHQGDENKDAREEHVALDGQEVGGDDTWTVSDPADGTVELRYPRDPEAPAGQVINCRCTMISVIPEGSASNADAIVEQG